MNSPLVPIDPGVPSFLALVFVVAPIVVLFLTATIPSASPLMVVLLLWTRPCNHGMHVEVVLPILFLYLGMCEHDNPSVILASAMPMLIV